MRARHDRFKSKIFYFNSIYLRAWHLFVQHNPPQGCQSNHAVPGTAGSGVKKIKLALFYVFVAHFL